MTGLQDKTAIGRGAPGRLSGGAANGGNFCEACDGDRNGS